MIPVFIFKMEKWFENKDRKYKKIYPNKEVEHEIEHENKIEGVPYSYYFKKYWYWIVIIILIFLFIFKN